MESIFLELENSSIEKILDGRVVSSYELWSSFAHKDVYVFVQSTACWLFCGTRKKGEYFPLAKAERELCALLLFYPRIRYFVGGKG